MRHLTYRCAFLLITGLLLIPFCSTFGCSGSATPLSASLSTRANEKIYTTDPISVTFSQPMNQESVEAAFTITGSDPVPGTFSWTDNTLTFTRESGFWKTNHTYTLTITTDAKTSAQSPIPEPIEMTFTPRINLHDVNGDGLDDFMLGSVHHTFNNATNSGIAYLFLGKNEWSDVDLSSASPDVTIGFEQPAVGLGVDARVVGDINGDGYADMVISALAGTGLIFIKYGSATPENITLTFIDDTIPATFDTLNQLDGIAIGPTDVTALGFPITPAGDINGDGLADFIVSGRYAPAPDENTKHWLILGRTEAFSPYTNSLATMPTADAISNAKYTVFGDMPSPGMTGFPVAACDINGDEFNDLVFGSPESDVAGATRAGKVFVVAGSDSPSDRDLITGTADQTISGTGANMFTGAGLGCGDINGDGYADLIVGAPGHNTGMGSAYLIAGNETLSSIDLATDQPMAKYIGPSIGSWFGVTDAVLGDVNGDGRNDYILSAPTATVDGTDFRGQAFLFLGAESPQSSVDLSAGGETTATYSGPVPPNTTSPGNISMLGATKAIGDVNGDGMDDILIGAPLASEGGVLERGIVYLMFGSDSLSSIDFSDGSPNVKILGAAADDKLGVVMPVY